MLWQSAGEVSDASPQSFLARAIDSEDRAVAPLILSSEFSGELGLPNPTEPMNDKYFTTHLIRRGRKQSLRQSRHLRVPRHKSCHYRDALETKFHAKGLFFGTHGVYFKEIGGALKSIKSGV